jgi:thiol:disulfide interchange protein DsbA
MKRRDFSLTLAASGLGLALLPIASHAQGGPVEGRQYQRLAQPAAVNLPDASKKVEVLEFFWYGCPACNAFEPLLEAWAKRLPDDVLFRHVPVGFAVPHQMHQKLYYALERMGQLERLHRRIFAAMHQQGQRLLNERDIIAWVGANGVNAEEFTGIFRSMAVDSRSRQARQLSDAYKIDGVPTLGVHGRFTTSATLAGGFERSLQVADFLIQRARQGA